MDLKIGCKGSGQAPVWALQDFADRKGVSVRHLRHLARRAPLPVHRAMRKSHKPTRMYELATLEEWYMGVTANGE